MPETLPDALAAFLRGREAAGATAATLRTYAADLDRFCRSCTDLTAETLENYLADLRGRMKPVSVHRHYRALRTFTRWLVRTGRTYADPMAGIRMRLPQVLPRVPTDDDVRRLLDACPSTPEGRRNRALVALLADAALRKEEARRLRVGDVDLSTRLIRVVGGKGQRDGVTPFGEATASMLRAWLAVHPDPRPGCFLFVTREGVPLGPWAFVRILHRLSRRAGLDRPVGPHALRHYAATSVWRRTGDLALTQRLLRHTTLHMALRYVRVTETELAARFLTASPVDHLRAGGRPQHRSAVRW